MAAFIKGAADYFEARRMNPVQSMRALGRHMAKIAVELTGKSNAALSTDRKKLDPKPVFASKDTKTTTKV